MVNLSHGLFPAVFVVGALAVFVVGAAGAGCTRTTGRPELDAESAACINCHAARRDHSIGVDYAEAIKLKKAPLVALDSLNPSVRLIGGRIGCATCHVRYSEDDHKQLATKRKDAAMPDPMLVMDNGKSGLCFACHRK